VKDAARDTGDPCIRVRTQSLSWVWSAKILLNRKTTQRSDTIFIIQIQKEGRGGQTGEKGGTQYC